MFGKFENEILIKAPATFTIDDMVYYQPSDEMYKNQGYKEIVETEYPTMAEGEEKYFESRYEETEDKIVKVWYEADKPAEVVKPSIEERVMALEDNLNVAMEAIDYLVLGESEVYNDTISDIEN